MKPTRRGVYHDLKDSPYIYIVDECYDIEYKFPSNAQLQKFIRIINENQSKLTLMKLQLKELTFNSYKIEFNKFETDMIIHTYKTLYKEWRHKGIINE